MLLGSVSSTTWYFNMLWDGVGFSMSSSYLFEPFVLVAFLLLRKKILNTFVSVLRKEEFSVAPTLRGYTILMDKMWQSLFTGSGHAALTPHIWEEVQSLGWWCSAILLSSLHSVWAPNPLDGPNHIPSSHFFRNVLKDLREF